MFRTLDVGGVERDRLNMKTYSNFDVLVCALLKSFLFGFIKTKLSCELLEKVLIFIWIVYIETC